MADCLPACCHIFKPEPSRTWNCLISSAVVAVDDAAVGQHAVHVQHAAARWPAQRSLQGLGASSAHLLRRVSATLRRTLRPRLDFARVRQIRPIKSVMSSRPTGRPVAVDHRQFADLAAAAGSRPRPTTRVPSGTVIGCGVITSRMGRSRASSRRCSKSRARSLSVNRPQSRPASSTSMTAPVRRPRRAAWANTSRTVSSRRRQAQLVAAAA